MGLAEEKYGCRSYVSVLEEGLTYIEKRMTGEIKSLKTPWPGFNQAGVGGSFIRGRSRDKSCVMHDKTSEVTEWVRNTQRRDTSV